MLSPPSGVVLLFGSFSRLGNKGSKKEGECRQKMQFKCERMQLKCEKLTV